MNKHLALILPFSALTFSGCKPTPAVSPTVPPLPPTQEQTPLVPAKQPSPKEAEISAKVRKTVAEQLKIAPDRVTPNSTWQQLGADSLDTVELVMAFEEEFKVSISDAQAEAMRTVGDAVSYLVKHSKP